MLSTLLYAINFLWSFNNDLGQTSQNYPAFVLSMMVAAVLLLRAHILVGPDPSRIEDWRVHFEKIARRYFVVAALLSVMSVMVLMEEGSSNGLDAASSPFWAGVALCSTGAIFEQTWVRGTVSIIMLILVIAAGYVLFTQGVL